MTKKKEIIFNNAIKLIDEQGYEAFNLRTLAEMSGIKVSTIYSHFSSKQEILDNIYSFYTKHFFDNQASEDYIKNIILNGTKNEIIDAMIFRFESSDPMKSYKMLAITKIVYSRIYSDKKAAEIFFNVMLKDREEEIVKLLEYGISVKRFKPFNTKTFAAIMCSSLHILGIKSIAKISSEKKLEEEKDVKNLLANMIPLERR